MSEVAGRMAAHVGARCLEKENGGRGVLLSGVPGVSPATVVILGGGVAGSNAALVASGMGAEVAVLDRNPEALRRLDAVMGGRVRTLFSTRDVVEHLCRRADVVIGTVLVPGATAPKLISAKTVKAMKPGAVIIDVAIDQGGCAETSRPTTHSHPTYIVDDVVHYCVANMPGAVARTSTFALSNVASCWRSPTRAGAKRSPTTPICATVSTSTTAASPTAPSPTRWGCDIRRRTRRCADRFLR
jgi:alanine dehydrogenase